MAPADELGKCPDPQCGSTDKGTRYLITPPSEGNPLGTYCRNAWHDAPPLPADESHNFTEREFQFIFGACLHLANKDIAQQYEIAEDTVKHNMMSVFDKAGLSGRLELVLWVRAALNEALRRRLGPE